MSARQAKAVDHVAGLVEVIQEQERDVRRSKWGHNLLEVWRVSAMGEYPAQVRLWPKESATPPGPGERERQINVAQDSASAHLWQRHRIIYDLDATLWAELGDTDESTVIPAGLMTRLPHPDPFVYFPDPVVVPVNPGEVMRVLGFFVAGRADAPTFGETLCSTHDERANGDLGLLFAGLVTGARSGLPVDTKGSGGVDIIWTRITLDVRHGDISVGEIIQRMAPRFQATDGGGGFASVPPLVRAAVSTLVYLCATNSDVSPPVRMARPPQRRVMGGKAEVVSVGYHVGTAIRKAEEEVRRSGGSTARVSAKLRAPVRPHIRRAHFHTYRVGKGRAEKVVKWLAPVAVNVTAGGVAVPTVVPVR